MIKKSLRNEIFDGGEVYKYKGMPSRGGKKSLSASPYSPISRQQTVFFTSS